MENSEDILIPDANVFESGLYYLVSAQLNSWFLQGALRYDFRKVNALADAPNFVDYGFILPGEPENRRLDRNFSGLTGSLGATRKISESQQFKLNLSSGYRAPDLAELFSNGPHPGTSRFEKGKASFEREQSFQIDAGYSINFRDFSAEISAFGSRVENYIFFAKSDEAPPEGHNELWTYDQTRAGLYGFEFQISKYWLAEQRLKTQISGAIVRARDLEKAEPLSFIPPDNFNMELKYFALRDKSLEFSTRLRLVSEQNRPGFNEESTRGYELLNLGISKTFYTGANRLKAGVQVQNALNKTYVDHMSILRAFDVSSPGRNFMLNMRYEF
jgi:iron complex outermembrane receptor protein